MATGRRLRLRVLEGLADANANPSGADAVRARLGGRAATSDPRVGSVVHVQGRDGAPCVVLFADDADAHVWIGEGLVRRVAATELRPHDGEVPLDHAAVAEHVSRFAALTEGDRVAFLDAEGATRRGTLLEKHRFGALVAEPSGTVLGVGFRRVWSDGPGSSRD